MNTGVIKYPEFPFDDEFQPKQKMITKHKGHLRATDSEGRFTIEPPMPNPELQAETENRRQVSMANRLRQQSERIMELEAEIKKLRSNG